MSKSFENGKTQANLESLAQTVDRIWNHLTSLPCAEHTKTITANKTALKFLWGLIALGVAALLTLIGFLIKGP